MESHDETFELEQRHLSETYARLERMRDELTRELEVRHASIAQDLIAMSEEVSLDFIGADETMETLAAIETLNSVIDAYNQHHDFSLDKMRRIILLLAQPYFAKVSLVMRPGRPAREVYIGAAGITDERSRPIIVDWRSPVAETYYNQQMGTTTYEVNGRTRTVELELRRQFDITRSTLNMYFDTTVAIQDSLLLGALKRHHTEKLQAITATIQREQNQVVRHDDVPALLVDGIAGSGKTSVMLQRIAFLLYRQRETLEPSQVCLFTPNTVFESYIDQVLPTMGESNPQTFTWHSFLASLGLSERASGTNADPASLEILESRLDTLAIERDDVRGIAVDGIQLIKPTQVKAALDKFSRFPVGPRLIALATDDLHERLERRFAQMAHSEEVQEELLSLDIEEQVETLGRTLGTLDEAELVACARDYVSRRYGSAHDAIDSVSWLRIDRLGMRMLDRPSITAAEWLYLRLLVTGQTAEQTRYVMIDEVQDYTVTQLMVLARHFSRAHFLLLGDRNQAIREGTASFEDVADVLGKTHGTVEVCKLRTSYRSSPEITELFASLVPEEERMSLSSVRRAGIAPRIEAFDDTDAYLDALRQLAAEAGSQEGLTAIVANDDARAGWLARRLAGMARRIRKGDALPATGVVVLDLRLAKGLEFDHVIVPDAQERVYPASDLARRQLYTAISRAMHRISILSQGPITPLLAGWQRGV